MFRDLRYSLRSLLKRPGFTVVVVATLALGIGVNAAIFSVFNLLLRPLPVREPESIVRLFFEEGSRRADRFSFTDYSYIRDHNQSFSGVLAVFEEERFLLGENRLNSDPSGEMDTTVLVRTTTDAATLKDLARREAYAVEPVLRLSVNTFEEIIAREQTIMFAASHGATVLGTLALMLAVIGLYGVMAWSVVQRTREIGIRMALGAQAHNILLPVLGQGMKLVVIGAVIGIPASLAAARLLSSMLIGLTTSDALSIGVVTALLVGVTLLACYLPARRATRVDPLETLRYE